jgi:hypothetical protein
VVIAIVPLLWYVPNTVLFFGDQFPFWSIDHYVRKEMYVWEDYNLGQRNAASLLVIHDVIGNSLFNIGVNSGFLSIMEYSFLMIIAGIGMFLLIKKQVIPDAHPLTVNLSALFYIANVHLIVIFFNSSLLYAYAFVPLWTYLSIGAIKFFAESKFPSFHVLTLSLTSIFAFSLISLNPANSIIVISIVISFSLAYAIKSRIILKKEFWTYSLVAVAILLVTNSWWLYNAASYYLRASDKDLFQTAENTNVSAWAWTHQNGQIERLLNLSGHWDFNLDNYPFFHYFTNPIVWWLMYLPFMLFVISYIRHRHSQYRFWAYTLVLIFTLAIFFAKGINEPFSSLNKLIYEKVFVFNVFREPVSKFMVIAVFSLAISISLAFTNKQRIDKGLGIGRISLFIVLAILLLIPAVPLLKGDVLKQPRYGSFFNGISFRPQNEIPTYWKDVNSLLDSNTRTLILPADDFYQQGYVWGSYGVDNMARAYIAAPTVTSLPDNYINNKETVQAIGALYNAFSTGDVQNFSQNLENMRIGQIILRNDQYWNLPNRHIMNPAEAKHILSSVPNIEYEGSSGSLDVYKYTMTKSVITSDNNNSVFTFVKSNPTEYHVSFLSQDPFHLQLAVASDPLWKASYGEQNWLTMFFTPSLQKQSVPNDFGNRWVVEDTSGQSKITIMYTGQAYFNLLVITSAIAVVLLVAINRLPLVRKRIRNSTL